MKQLLVLVVISCILMTTLCCIATAIGHLEPTNIEIVPGLRMCKDTLCYLKIIPNETSLTETQQIMTGLGATWVTPTSFVLPGYNALLLTQNNEIEELDIYFHTKNNIDAEEIISQLGFPCYVASMGKAIAIKYPHLAIFFTAEKFGNFWALGPTSYITEINLLGNTVKDCLPIDNKQIFQWHGFASYLANTQ